METVYLQVAWLAVDGGERVLECLTRLTPPRKHAPRRAVAGEAATKGNVKRVNRTLGRG